MLILNLTQHQATPSQKEAGLVDLPSELAAVVRAALTFDTVPTAQEIRNRAELLAHLASRADLDLPSEHPLVGVPFRGALIGGAPYLMGALEIALLGVGITPVYAFSVRDSTEEVQADGTVRKVNTFRHGGWVIL
jgi:hypothetical protein